MFETISGLKMNQDKTEIVKLGEPVDQICPFLNKQYTIL